MVKRSRGVCLSDSDLIHLRRGTLPEDIRTCAYTCRRTLAQNSLLEFCCRMHQTCKNTYVHLTGKRNVEEEGIPSSKDRSSGPSQRNQGRIMKNPLLAAVQATIAIAQKRLITPVQTPDSNLFMLQPSARLFCYGKSGFSETAHSTLAAAPSSGTLRTSMPTPKCARYANSTLKQHTAAGPVGQLQSAHHTQHPAAAPANHLQSAHATGTLG